jgi:hypothetical protein
VLSQYDVLEGYAHRAILDRAVSACRSCGRGRGARRCTGWMIEIERTSALVFKHALVRGRLVRSELLLRADFRRSEAGTTDRWQAQPLAQANVALEIYAAEDDRLVARHHLDLASRGQEGPVWHLQLSGNPPGDRELTDSWLSVPRWPLLPADAVLAAELAVYNFHPTVWQAMQADGQWVRLVQTSEDFLYTHYLAHAQNHFARQAPNRSSTWLAAQDNKSGWDPRPD